MTVSLLPDFLAAGYSETLDVQKKAIEASERCSAVTEAAKQLRPDIELQGACRWLRRRVRRHDLLVLLLSTALGAQQRLVDPRNIRTVPLRLLRQLPTPTGLAHRPIEHWVAARSFQQPMGPDPPQ
jgi:hypothetical protein